MRQETETALHAVANALRITDSRAGAAEVSAKHGIDLVTATDVICEDAIRTELLEAFPYPVVGEERGGVVRPGVPYWLVDPICGTRMFASDLPLYCSNVALVEDGVVTIGVVGMERTGKIAFAERDGGAWVRDEVADSRIETSAASRTLWVGAPTEHMGDVVGRIQSGPPWWIVMYPSSLGYAHVATGRVAGLVHAFHPEYNYGSVHTAAGCLVAEEAGAVVTNLEGDGWTLKTRSFLVGADGPTHEELMRRLHSTQ